MPVLRAVAQVRQRESATGQRRCGHRPRDSAGCPRPDGAAGQRLAPAPRLTAQPGTTPTSSTGPARAFADAEPPKGPVPTRTPTTTSTSVPTTEHDSTPPPLTSATLTTAAQT